MLKKSDLRTGMKVVTENGIEWRVLLNAAHEYDDTKDFLIRFDTAGWMKLSDYDDNLKIIDDRDRDGYVNSYDVKEVYEASHLMYLFKQEYGNIVWDKLKRKMTKEEIEKELGYKIEIVD